jgi:hypothetical protein
MALFTLKRYSRDVPDVNAGKLIAEWVVNAPDAKAAVVCCRKLLGNFNPSSENFAILLDQSGQPVWETDA